MTESQIVEWSYRLLFGIGGFVGGKLVGPWISSRFQSYEQECKAHSEDLKQKILLPLRDGLATHLRPLIGRQQPIITIEHAARQYSELASVTEEPSNWGPVMGAPFPTGLVFGPMPSVLLEDARKHHYVRLMKSVDKFVSAFSSYAGELHLWVSRIAKEILKVSGMPSFPNPPEQVPYVMHYQLAAFVYQRHFRFETGALRIEEDGLRRILKSGSYSLAVGSADEIKNLVESLNRMIESEAATGASLRERLGALHSQFDNLVGEIDFAISSRRSHGHCDLVTFF